jgi:hypothetical protein
VWSAPVISYSCRSLADAQAKATKAAEAAAEHERTIAELHRKLSAKPVCLSAQSTVACAHRLQSAPASVEEAPYVYCVVLRQPDCCAGSRRERAGPRSSRASPARQPKVHKHLTAPCDLIRHRARGGVEKHANVAFGGRQVRHCCGVMNLMSAEARRTRSRPSMPTTMTRCVCTARPHTRFLTTRSRSAASCSSAVT